MVLRLIPAAIMDLARPIPIITEVPAKMQVILSGKLSVVEITVPPVPRAVLQVGLHHPVLRVHREDTVAMLLQEDSKLQL